jgi:hypothetical protein
MINHAAALIEAGRPDDVVDAIAQLEASYPDAPQMPGLRNAPAELELRG